MQIQNFDKIYVLHLSEDTTRYNFIKNEYERMQLSNDVQIWWTCKRKIFEYLGPKLPSIHTDFYDKELELYPNLYRAVLDCALEHYTMIKTSYDRGFNNILIFEDDFAFNQDRQYFDFCLSQIPDNYGICKLYHPFGTRIAYTANAEKPLFTRVDEIDTTSDIPHQQQLLSTAAYCLDRKGMKLMLDSYDTKFVAADQIFQNVSDKSKIWLDNYRIGYIVPFRSNILTAEQLLNESTITSVVDKNTTKTNKKNSYLAI